MSMSENRHSIFSHSLDRIAFTSYFLGAIVPLIALAFVVNRYVIPNISESRNVIGIIALVVSIAVLSMASFLALRRSTRKSQRQMEADNARLESLLEASGSLSSATNDSDAAAASAHCAFTLSGVGAAYVLIRSGSDSSLRITHFAGDEPEKLFEEFERPLREIAELVLREGRPAIRGVADTAEALAASAVPIPGEAAPLGVLLVAQRATSDDIESPHVDSLATLAGLASVAFRHLDLQDAQRNFFSHVTDILVQTLDQHLGYHRGHANRVARLANRIGREMELDEHRLERLHFASLLHDVGMLKLDPSQVKNATSCEKHAELGFRMLNRIRLWQDLAPFVHHHHEWHDGTGYPMGLKGDAIPLEARIIGLCEALDSMASDASYKAPVPWEEALRKVDDCAGTQFDPEVARVFKILVAKGEIDSSFLQ